MPKKKEKPVQIVARKNFALDVGLGDSLAAWAEAYFELEVTTAPSSRMKQRRAIGILIHWLSMETGSDAREHWTPRRSRAFRDWCEAQKRINRDGGITEARRWSARSINTMLAHLRPFAKWIHRHRPFTLGNPMEKVAAIPTPTILSLERAYSKREEADMLDAADRLLRVGGLSRDRHRNRKRGMAPRRDGYRPYRNRAIVYTAFGSGLRRAAITKLTLRDVDFEHEQLSVIEKGGVTATIAISREALAAIREYIDQERAHDAAHFASSVLFLAASTNRRSRGPLSPASINHIWNQVGAEAKIPGKTVHGARHRVGIKVHDATGKLRAVQIQLNHKNPMYSMQYTNPSAEERKEAINS